ncbi:MAG: diacylglycerol kinase family lipid kinase [Lachnospiraceae bacterium]|nr:diacylglycerol kinase family lipid kinase [Lachnospiraceae bacterium]
MYYFIVNPSSSSRKGLKIWREAEKILKQRQTSYKAFLLKYPGQAREIAKKLCASKKPCTVTVVGGDGTVNEFVGGLVESEACSHITFACIPTGSGNDFARGLHLPKDPKEAVEAILDGSHTQMLHFGKTESSTVHAGDQDRHGFGDGNPDTQKTASFAVSSGFGYDAAACYEADRTSLKKLLNHFHLGRLVYVISALRMLIRIKPLPMDFELCMPDGEKAKLSFEKVYFIAAMNTPYEGGGFCFCPKADPTDELLDIIIAEGLPKWKVLLILPTALPGWHGRFRGIHLMRCTSISVRTTEDTCVHVDGEHFGFCREIRFSLHSPQIRMITGK